MATCMFWKRIPRKCLLMETSRRLINAQPKDFPLPSNAKEDRLKIGNQYIRYVTAGHGPHNVVCVPAGVGTILTDFKPQVEGFDGEKFTLITFDLPGFGMSTPPQKTYPLNFHEVDADITHEFLKTLGVTKYSLLGWCYGGIVSMIYAAKHPDEVTKLVVWGAGSHLLPQELESYKLLLDINLWSPSIMQPRVDVYGEELLAKNWTDLVNAIARRYKETDGDFCREFLKHIQCPTFILHGEKDPLIDGSHVEYLKNNIRNSRTYIYPGGNHNVHLRYADDFNKRVEKFLLENTEKNSNA